MPESDTGLDETNDVQNLNINTSIKQIEQDQAEEPLATPTTSSMSDSGFETGGNADYS